MNYDVITAGGGLAGSTLAAELASAGYKVLVLERETQFKDRVRGENMLPWGVAAARRLGVLNTLVAAGGRQAPEWVTYMGGREVERRDLCATTPHGEGAINIYHPHMQEALLARALAAGAEVTRGANVVGLDAGPGRAPSVTFLQEGKRQTVSARLVVGADGRESYVRGLAGFEVERNPDFLMIAGTLLENVSAPEHAVHLCFGQGCASLMAPLGGGRVRTYYVYPGASRRLGLSGQDRTGQFVALCRTAGVDENWVEKAESGGPLAEFSGSDRWVKSPVRDGVALLGDAAALSDPSWGCGLALTLLDVEQLAKALIENADWEEALRRYAVAHDEHYSALHRVLGWMTELVYAPGADADLRRQRVLPRMMADPRGFPDPVGQGPFGPSDESARMLVMGMVA